MYLLLPESALGEKLKFFIVANPRHVNGCKPLPLGVALGGRHLGLFIDGVLEVIYKSSVWDKGDRAGKVIIFKLLCILGEEALRPRP